MEGQSLTPIAILGAGSWGTALSLYLARRGQTVHLWSIETSEITDMLKDGANTRYLPGIPLPSSLKPIADLKEAVNDVQDILIVVPSVGFKQTLLSIKPLISSTTRIICATKGLDTETGQLLNDLAEEVLGKNIPYAVLSGPSFAREVAAGLPCAVVVASRMQTLAIDIKQRFNSPLFRVEQSDDVIGVEIGGVAKNVIAIATGMVDGMELGANARSALITRGLDEIMRLGIALGGKRDTFIGLSGLGDLILTCSDNQSRNRRLGLAIGKGKNIKEAEKEIGQVVEGKRNAELVAKLAKEHQINIPICETVWKVLQDQLSPQEALTHLL